jgi:thioester reductase-like protein
VSSVAVFESETYEQVLFATEDEDLSRSTGFHNGYDTTKWVAEQIISLARARGVPVSIYRLSNIAGHSQTGVMLPQHIIAAFLKGCVQLGAAPAGDNIVNLLPVDTASRMLVELSLQPGALGGTYHVVSPEATWVRDIMQWLIARGYGLQGRSYEEWREELRQAPEDNVLKVFLPLLDEAPLFTNRRYDMANVGSRLQNLDRDYAFFNELLLERYLSYMFSSGYLRPAQGRVCASTACAPART